MKACMITEPFHYEIREVPVPEPGDQEVQIKMMAAGVCGSDMHIFKGENPCSSYPLIPGHENCHQGGKRLPETPARRPCGH